MNTADYVRSYNYKAGGVYLVKKYCSVVQIEILVVTSMAYKIRWESGNSSWQEKDDFNFEYKFIEHLNKQQ